MMLYYLRLLYTSYLRFRTSQQLCKKMMIHLYKYAHHMLALCRLLQKMIISLMTAADLTSYPIDVAVITETSSVVGVSGYTVFRRDRERRREGGGALYVLSTIQSSVWTYSADDDKYELLWVCVGNDNNTFVGALYHPPNPIYNQLDLLNYIEACVQPTA